MRLFQFAFLFSLIYSQYHSSEWGTITSLLTPTGIKATDEGLIYASTSGGLLAFNPEFEEFNFIKREEGLEYLDLASISIDNHGRIWLGGANPKGCLQVYDPEIGLVKYFEDDFIVSIDKIQIDEDIAFAIYNGSTSSEIGILEFQIDPDGLPNYRDYYTNFTSLIVSEIHDLDIFQNSVYVTTNQGIFVGNISDNLKFLENWNEVYIGSDAKQFLPGDFPITLGDSSIIQQQGDDWEDYCTDFTGNIIQAWEKDDKISILTEENYYEISDCVINDFHIPLGDQSVTPANVFDYNLSTFFTSFDYSNNGRVYIGIRNHGILSWDRDQDSYITYTPNTPNVNAFPAITVTKSGHLAATSHFGTLYYNGTDFKNYIPVKYYNYYSDGSATFQAVSLDYYPGYGEHFPISIVEKDNGNLIYCNSGVFPDSGTVIELNHLTDSLIKYDNTNNIIDGRWGIHHQGSYSNFMLVNQILKDSFDNIWIVNPYCEKNGHLLAIQSADDDSWSHINIPDSSSFRPQTISFDQSSRAWVGFAYEALENSIYSNGGIKVFDPAISSWKSVTNQEKLPGNDPNASVWSLVFDEMDFLWVLNEKGIRGLTYSVHDNNITLDPLLKSIDGTAIDFLSHISYKKGNRIKVDSQNNKWIITHQGVWVIQESMAYWPSEYGLNEENSGLLSDIVYDVAFDNDRGLAYLTTDKGISILQIPFADNPAKAERMYISPNPFIVPDNEFVLIKNIPSGSTIQIMTITGIMMKTIKLGNNVSQALWDGYDDKGKSVGTAVYLVAAHHPTKPNMVSKIAVIRK